MTHKPEPRNLLAGQSSPYLLQHADNPVHWRPWGDAALSEARDANRPILLSVGYAACHWCHVMAHECFENDEIAALMNGLYVNIKVDREERPDIDQIYMSALHAMGEQGGWPLTMFLAPDGRPFWGGTYFPPEPRHGRPGFAQVLLAVDKAWRDDRDTVERNAAALHRHLSAQSAAPDAPSAPPADQITAFADASLQLHDARHGGVRGAPKFPNAPLTELWLRAARRDPDGPAAKAFLRTIEQMSRGGIYDHLAGGLSRYSVDDSWLVPHFEKMLYDSAHYLRALLWAWLIDPRDLFRDRIEKTIGWLAEEMTLPGGAFASSIDADSEGEEGKYYVWSHAEIADALGPDAEFFCQCHDVTEAGNFEGTNVLNSLNCPSLAPDDRSRLAKCRQILADRRKARTPPGRDDKVLADWNGYMIRALAETGLALCRPDWIDRAETAFHFICESMSDGAELFHSRRNDAIVRPALLTDYGAMMNAALSLHAATSKPHYLDRARQWRALVETDYSDGKGGFYLASEKAGVLIARPRADNDDPNPSGASQILEAVARLAHLLGETELLDRARKLAANIHAATRQSRYGTGGFHNALDTLFNGRSVTLFVEKERSGPWREAIAAVPDPALVWKLASDIAAPAHLGAAMTPPANQADAAIICTEETCSAPLPNPQALAAALRSTS